MTTVIHDRAAAVRFADAQTSGGLRVIPILGPSVAEPAYRLVEGDAAEGVSITEVDRRGRVPDLRVENTLDTRVFIMDGQELLGAKQNRIVNVDVMVAARTTLEIPVSCVERGRWAMKSRQFAPGRSASSRLRRGKAAAIHASLRKKSGPRSDQGAVWAEVDACLNMYAVDSPSQAMADVYNAREDELREARDRLSMPETAVGMAVFRGPEFVGLDIFDRHSTLAHYWDSVIDGYAIDTLEAPVTGDEDARPEAAAIADVLHRAAEAEWETFEAPGEGRDHRLQTDDLAGSALVWDDRVVIHLQLFPRDLEAEARHAEAMESIETVVTYEPPPARPVPARPVRGDRARWGATGRCPCCGFTYRWDGACCDHCGHGEPAGSE